MLEKLRNSTQTIYAKIIIILIIASFAFLGIGGVIRSSVGDYAIKVGDYKISNSTLNSEVQKTMNFYRNYYGDAISEEILQTIPFVEITTNRLIKHYLLLQETKNLKITIPDEVIFEQIFANNNFLTDNKFDKVKFNEFLRKNKISEAFYINFIKEYLSVEMLQSLFQNYSGDYSGVNALVSEYYNQNKLVNLYKISVANLFDQSFPISEAELIAYHEENSQNFVKAESRQIQYLDFSCKNMARFVELTEADIANAYQENASLYSVPEIRVVKQLFFQDELDAKSAQADIVSGLTLEQIITKYEINDSVVNIGEVTRAQIIDEFGDVVFATDNGKYTDTIKGPVGFHIFYIDEIKLAQKQPLSKVRDQLIADLTEQKSCAIAYENFNEAEAEVNSGSNLDEIAYKYQLEVQTDEDLARDGDLFGTIATNYPEYGVEVVNEFFNSEETGDNFSAVIGSDILLFYDIGKIVPERVKTLDEVKGLVTDIIKQQKQQQAQYNLASKLHQKLVANADLADMKDKYELINDQNVNRNSTDLPDLLIENVLSTAVGGLTEPFYDNENNSFLIVKVIDKGMLDLNKFEIQQIDMEVAKDLNNTINNSLFESYLAYLRNKTEIIINVSQQQ
jgi:peptidyl-prolyl cis-trans isomerase D